MTTPEQQKAEEIIAKARPDQLRALLRDIAFYERQKPEKGVRHDH